ncbi:hypothetical protein H1235_00565 [Pseudoxanthomonas sp. NC8]|nr:hypothetical protein H1235_00565 [Pseudoxanthomonas sp. NC8]
MLHQGQDAVDLLSVIDRPILAVAGVIATALVAWAMIWLLQPVARRYDLLDHPGGRKDHAEATPVTGGWAWRWRCSSCTCWYPCR